jgi:uncharacterized protein YbjT (DUF2867 family)
LKTAILFGATGFVGSFLLEELLQSSSYARVIAVSRRPLKVEHHKLTVLIGDLSNLASLKMELRADDVFITIGTTRAKTPDEKEYYAIDHDYPVEAARSLKENGAHSVFLLTAVGADTESSLFYLRLKGEVERDIRALHYDHTAIFRPSMIMGARDESRPAERAFQRLWPVIDRLLAGSLAKYRGIEGRDIARAMVAAAAGYTAADVKIFHWQEMRQLIEAQG